MELQQALALSLESCAISESVMRRSPQRHGSSKFSQTGGSFKEQNFGWGSPEQKIPACSAVPPTDILVGLAPEASITDPSCSDAVAPVVQGKSSARRGAVREPAVAGRELLSSSGAASVSAAAARRREFDIAQQDSATTPPVARKAHSCSGSHSKQSATARAHPSHPQHSRHAGRAALSSDQAGCGSTVVESRSNGTAASSAQTQPGAPCHPIAVCAKPGPLARSPAVSPAKRHAILPQELAKSTKANVWNLFPA